MARNLKRIIVVAYVLSVSLLGSYSSQAVAATLTPGSGLRITPPLVDVTVEKGDSRTIPISVQNLTPKEVTVQSIVNDFIASSDESGQPRLILDATEVGPTNSFKLIAVPLQTVTLGPNERRQLNFTVHVPETAPSGGYYGAVRFSPGDAGAGNSIALTASVGTVFLVRVPGNLTEKLTIESFGVARENRVGTVFGSGPLNIQTRFRNRGNIHVQPYGKIYIKNFSGNIVQEVEVNDSQPRGSVLPDSIRKFNTPLDSKHLLGRYTADASFGYGMNGELLLARQTFYVIPYRLIVAIVIGLLLLIFVLPRLIRALRAHRRRKTDV